MVIRISGNTKNEKDYRCPGGFFEKKVYDANRDKKIIVAT